jgi:hypothetical protein
MDEYHILSAGRPKRDLRKWMRPGAASPFDWPEVLAGVTTRHAFPSSRPSRHYDIISRDCEQVVSESGFTDEEWYPTATFASKLYECPRRDRSNAAVSRAYVDHCMRRL